jgi:hypothetical protein
VVTDRDGRTFPVYSTAVVSNLAGLPEHDTRLFPPDRSTHLLGSSCALTVRKVCTRLCWRTPPCMKARRVSASRYSTTRLLNVWCPMHPRRNCEIRMKSRHLNLVNVWRRGERFSLHRQKATSASSWRLDVYRLRWCSGYRHQKNCDLLFFHAFFVIFLVV